MPRGDATVRKVTQGDATKSRCVTPQVLHGKAVTSAVTQVTQINPFNSMRAPARGGGTLREKRHCVTFVTTPPVEAQKRGWVATKHDPTRRRRLRRAPTTGVARGPTRTSRRWRGAFRAVARVAA